ncbi:MAG: HD domain-containing phosphohydrolase [Desulfobacula sp.]|jgi:putative nucleotidyltransferase with HDIG domain
MSFQSKEKPEDRLVFADEDISGIEPGSVNKEKPWKILIVDDEEDIHEITRITLRKYSFENRDLELLSAYCEDDVRMAFKQNEDIALVLLDVVMEKEDTGLCLVEYIRKDLNNSSVRIVLRTGQPGKAPEQEVIRKYDINDYKTKPEFTAQKLFTTVTACLRAYENLKTIEKNNEGLESVIRSSAEVFKNQSFSQFGENVLLHLFQFLHLDNNSAFDCGYLIGMPNSSVVLMAGSGRYKNEIGRTLDESMPEFVIENYQRFEKIGGESTLGNEYVGVFKTMEGFGSILYLNGWDRLSDIEKKLIRIYANNIAIGFDNISLAREIINTQKEVILTLGEIVETRSQETANHVTRVAEICNLLAKKIGMDEKICDLLRLATPMHDVGKIGVPEAILNKPGKLTTEEFEVIKKHTQTGYEILRKSNRPIMKAAAIVALQHHERWDGLGYPQGLSGEGIHIYGRIAAIADVFDALSHKRCYKTAWSMNQVVDFFKKESGKHFDKSLIEIFLQNSKDFEAINRHFPE